MSKTIDEMNDAIEAARVPFDNAVKEASDKKAFAMDSGSLFKIPKLGDTPTRLLAGHQKKIQAMAWHPDPKSHMLMACDQIGLVMIWDAIKGAKMHFTTKTFVQACAMHPVKPLCCVGSMLNSVTVFNYEEEVNGKMALSGEYPGADGYITSVVFQNESSFLAGTADGEFGGEIWKWDLSSKSAPVTKFKGHMKDANSVCYPKGASGKDRQVFLTCSTDKTMRIWDARAGPGYVMRFDCKNEVNCCDWHPSGMAIAGGLEQHFVQMFDIRSAAELNAYKRNKQKFTGIQFSLSGRVIYTACEDGCLCPFDVFANCTGDQSAYTQKLEAHVKPVKPNVPDHNKIIGRLLLKPDGEGIATGGYDSYIKIWTPAA